MLNRSLYLGVSYGERRGFIIFRRMDLAGLESVAIQSLAGGNIKEAMYVDPAGRLSGSVAGRSAHGPITRLNSPLTTPTPVVRRAVGKLRRDLVACIFRQFLVTALEPEHRPRWSARRVVPL